MSAPAQVIAAARATAPPVAALLMTLILFVRTQGGQSVDNLAYDNFLRLAPAAGRFSTILIQLFLWALFVDSCIHGLPLWRGGKRAVILRSLLLFAGAIATTFVIKHYLLRRPALDFSGPWIFLENTSPSGHATLTSAAVLSWMSIRRGLGPLPFLLALGAPCFSGITLVARGAHRPSDIIAAFAVSAMWAALTTGPSCADDGRMQHRNLGSAVLTVTCYSVTAALLSGRATSPTIWVTTTTFALATAGVSMTVFADALLSRRARPPCISRPPTN